MPINLFLQEGPLIYEFLISMISKIYFNVVNIPDL